MKLAKPFFRLPLRFDVERLQAEVAQFSESEWQRHPTGFSGNSAVRLISVSAGENDDFVGEMQPTAQLQRCPYIQQILQQFGVVWSRSRLMRLSPGAGVPAHSDVDYHWFHRVRIHIPIFTARQVTFTCDDQTVNMAAGEAWIFDNLRAHQVHNGSAFDRVHLVADTTGNARFWAMANASQSSHFAVNSNTDTRLIPFQQDCEAALQFERFNSTVLMPPAEVEQLTDDLLGDIRPPQNEDQAQLRDQITALALGFARDWRALWSSFADTAEGWPHYRGLRDRTLGDLEKLSPKLVYATNGVPAIEVLQRRVLLHAFRASFAVSSKSQEINSPSADKALGSSATKTFHKPVFIVAVPRSGSTLLFETLAKARSLSTLGGEAHALVEALPQLRPGVGGVESNRLTAAHVDEEVRAHIFGQLSENLVDRDGLRPAADALRFLEKTPKNALRVPFFNELFPDARFVFLWRDARENISSIMQAWRAGRWRTYQSLPGWHAPWSMLVPPGYRALSGEALERIAAFQWARTNEIILDDLAQLPRERWIALSYSTFLASPREITRRICEFAELDFDERHASLFDKPLPLSLHTLTPPDREKWRANELALEQVMPSLETLLTRLRALPQL